MGSPEGPGEVILPKAGKERQDAGDSGKGQRAARGRQEAATYGSGIKGDRRASVQLFESEPTIFKQYLGRHLSEIKSHD